MCVCPECHVEHSGAGGSSPLGRGRRRAFTNGMEVCVGREGWQMRTRVKRC